MKEEKWNDRFDLLNDYIKKNGHSFVPFNYVVKDKNGNDFGLGYFVWSIRKYYNGEKSRYKFTDEQINDLKSIGFSFECDNVKKVRIHENWFKNYEFAKKYYKENGHLDMPGLYVFTDNNGNSFNLGSWINTQKLAYQNRNGLSLNEEQIILLEKIGMNWEKDKSKRRNYISDKWMKKYNCAKEFYLENGNLEIPYNYMASCDDIEFNLFKWIESLKYNYKADVKSLNEKQVSLLNEIGMNWNSKSLWTLKYELCKKYYEENHNLLIPRNYTVTYKGTDINLYSFISSCRYNKIKLDNEKIEKLNEIGMIWDWKAYKKILKELKLILNRYKDNPDMLNKYINLGLFDLIDGNVSINYDFVIENVKVKSRI